MKVPVVIYEDNHLLIVDKPSGWLVQGDYTGDKTLTDWGRDYIAKKYHKPGNVFLHPTHRLDRPVSGIVVLARTSKALERMNKLFQDNKVNKTYCAIVEGKPQSGSSTLEHWLIKDQNKNITKAYSVEKKGSKKAILSYRVQSSIEKHSLLLVYPQTGRSHQIRVQLSAINCPIQGDLKYGYKHPNKNKSISLHAFKLSFMHPVKKDTLNITCIPEGLYWEKFKKNIDALGRKT
jgi:23S rRNA pseudouridine1911/1915/1917 synthase